MDYPETQPFPHPQLKNAALEISLKAFHPFDPKQVRKVARRLFEQWRPLTQWSDAVSVLLWTADGSEILDYPGRDQWDESFEWAKYIGVANPRERYPNDPEKVAIHNWPRPFTENPADLTYRTLAELIGTIKQVGQEVSGKPVRIGATFDPGGEFAVSSFKYERHNEVCMGDTMGSQSFVCCYATLHGDDRAYAGFPGGIPEGLPFGTFLGRQSQHFLKDLGYDYLWFSNGFGFGMETWRVKGPLFDGNQFFPERAAETRQKILDFWRYFRDECPAYPIETRGTNLGTGTDFATDAVPLREIYEGGFNIVPPPNSPWAALDGDIGIELAGYMSRLAGIPEGQRVPFRYYVHDPWFLNSPWLDRFGRQPWDLYLPLSVSLLDRHGQVRPTDSVSLFTMDDSFGQMPDRCPREILPHLAEALEHAPDAPGPLVWVYPFDEVQDALDPDAGALGFFNDWFMRSAINDGLPLNTVISTRNLAEAIAATPTQFHENLLLSPVPAAGTAWARAILEHLRAGGDALLYGPIRGGDPDVLEALNLTAAPDEPWSGELALELGLPEDDVALDGAPRHVIHRELMSAGGVAACVRTPLSDTHVVARACRGDEHRVLALWRDASPTRGRVGWVRGTNANRYVDKQKLPRPDDPRECFVSPTLMRLILNAFGWTWRVAKDQLEQRHPITTIARHRNAFHFSGYVPDTTVDLRLRMPQGVPLLLDYEVKIEEGVGRYRLPRSWRCPCRVFVEQETGVVSCTQYVRRRLGLHGSLNIRGLRNARLRFYPDTAVPDAQPQIQTQPQFPFVAGPLAELRHHRDQRGDYYEARGLQDNVLLTW